MDRLKDEIARKRKEMEDLKLMNDSKKKYFKRSELEDKQLQVLLTKQSKCREIEDAKAKEIENDRNEKNEKLKEDEEKVEKKILPRGEVVRRLRERGQPVRLFGESDEDCAKRLNTMESKEVDVSGMRNDFKVAMDKSEQESLNEIMNSIDSDHNKNHDLNANTESDEQDDEAILNEIMKMVEIKNDRNNDCMLVVKYFKFILKKWTAELNTRPLVDKLKVSGKIDTALHAQTVSYLKPLFRKLKSKTLSEDILDSLVKIVYFLVDRNYIKANEIFLEMAIGNAPWPIGATMVGIHARPGRERIASKHVAHVLNDETQRKYIQAVKRLISKNQQFFTTDPSRCVEYGLKNDSITIIPGGK